MRIASFNVENLFARAVALNRDDWVNDPGPDPDHWSAGRVALDTYSKLNAILQKAIYSAQDKADIISLMTKLDLTKSDDSKLVILRRNRGQLVKRPKGKPMEVIATGRGDWIGWLELKKEPVDETATQNTARIIKEVNADIMVVIEADDRISLCRFNQLLIKAVGGQPYNHIMLIDGNDERGIDVGLITRASATIDLVRSHVDDRSGSSTIFSRDCPEFHLKLANGTPLVILANHMKSKGFGSQDSSNKKRKAQALRTRQIYDELRAAGVANIVLAGDFNDTLDSDPLSPLFDNGSDLKDVSAHPAFQDGGRPGTHGNCTKGSKIDHVLLSPALWAKVTACGIDRRGIWGGKNGKLWPHLPEITNANQAASDHAAVWVDLAI
jgi:endonuclease/exonuclease/phosphatase family metal-dependent hydrolase